MKHVLLSSALLLCACAAHNSHRVPIDLNAQLAPLIDEAWTQMETDWNEPVPVGGVPVEVEVEPVAIHWLPYDEQVPPGGSVLSQAELRDYIVEALRLQTTPVGPDADRSVRVELAADLHQPDALALRVVCRLIDTNEREQVARGTSSCLRFERLYCHGCRDHWTGLGTELPADPVPSDGYDGGSGGVFFGIWHWHSSPGYHKH